MTRGKPGRWLTLDLLRQVRQGSVPASRVVEGMGHELRIPELDYAVLQRRFPDLVSPDHEIKLKAWKRFLASSASDPYRVRPRSLVRVSKPGDQRPDSAPVGNPGMHGIVPMPIPGSDAE